MTNVKKKTAVPFAFFPVLRVEDKVEFYMAALFIVGLVVQRNYEDQINSPLGI